jgi:hypothetical protein
VSWLEHGHFHDWHSLDVLWAKFAPAVDCASRNHVLAFTAVVAIADANDRVYEFESRKVESRTL